MFPDANPPHTPADPPLALESILASTWSALERGAADARHPFHTMVIASVDASGAPHARTVVLRHADRSQTSIGFHTDVRSPKIAELSANPSIAALFYDPQTRVQIRLRGRAAVHTLDARARAAWEASAEQSRRCYLAPVGSSVEIDSPFVNEPLGMPTEPGYANFALVTITIETCEWLQLHHEGHRRARFDLTGGAPPTWLTP